ncbi:MAG: uncharacterized protein A8A55_3426 [Amphiamblys sp. WSBS2006]|nr:MAG: uncharacterized protein A8A55_3426 [Amphiamblys sp. WSBS2006]
MFSETTPSGSKKNLERRELRGPARELRMESGHGDSLGYAKAFREFERMELGPGRHSIAKPSGTTLNGDWLGTLVGTSVARTSKGENSNRKPEKRVQSLAVDRERKPLDLGCPVWERGIKLADREAKLAPGERNRWNPSHFFTSSAFAVSAYRHACSLRYMHSDKALFFTSIDQSPCL